MPAAQELLALFREHWGPDFEIVDESHTASQAEPLYGLSDLNKNNDSVPPV